jgi:hypothetical protein
MSATKLQLRKINYAELCRIMQNYSELCSCIKIMHLHISHLGEFTQITHLPQAEERRVDAAGGCEDDAVVSSTTGLIRRSGRDAAVECDMARGRYVTT